MTTLRGTTPGRQAIHIAQQFLLRERLSRFFGRNVNIALDRWRNGGEFDIDTFVSAMGELNDAHDSEILDIFRLLGVLGAIPYSINNLEVYVNPVTGDDETGTGSASHPYASLWFLPFFSNVYIDHKYRIFIYGDYDHDGPLCISSTIGPSGCISFIGVGAEVVVNPAFSSTIQATAPLQATWNEIDSNGAVSTALCKSFVQMTSGANDNAAQPVCRADPANGLFWFRRVGLMGIAVNDGFRFVEPAHTITVEGLDVDTRGSRRMANQPLFPSSRVNFINLKISVDLSGQIPKTMVSLAGLPVGFWFCQIEVADCQYPINIRAQFNEFNPNDDIYTLKALSLLSIDNLFQPPAGGGSSCGCQVINPAADEYASSDTIIMIQGNPVNVYCLDCMAIWNIDRGSLFSIYCSFNGILASNSEVRLYYCALDKNNIAADTIIADSCNVTLGHCLFCTCDNGVQLFNSKCELQGGGGDVAATITNINGYAFKLWGNSAVYISSPWSGTAPAVNDLIFTDPAVDLAAAFPAVNTAVTDLLNNYCTRGDA